MTVHSKIQELMKSLIKKILSKKNKSKKDGKNSKTLYQVEGEKVLLNKILQYSSLTVVLSYHQNQTSNKSHSHHHHDQNLHFLRSPKKN